ncbi:MAG: phosphoglucomutase [Flavobacteriaceae bacterium]|jgi:phosphoglucomutase|tara:strand:- start:5440 stop:7146 length:1707 start_codon:yes stop_codon:yes gene_type:complete
MTLKDRINPWLKTPFDKETRAKVKAMQKYPKELEDAFYKDLGFGTGGMRGIMGVGTNRINKYTLGKNTQGLSKYLLKTYSKETIITVIAFDSRHQSKQLAKVVADVFTANGIQCFLFSDLRPTPELSFAVRHLNAHCGIVLTASHNTPEYNGYKVYGKDGGQLVPPQDSEIIEEIQKTTFEEITFYGDDKLLNYIDKEVDEAYQKTVLEAAKMHQLSKDDFKLVFTPIHGTSITALPQVLEKAGYQNVYIVSEQEKPNGAFPTVASPNPETKEALKMGIDLGNKKNADLVIGTDPDADRFGVVVRDLKNEWRFLNGNQVMMILTEYLLSKKAAKGELTPHHFIASTIVSTPAIEKMAAHYNIQFKKCLTGFKWIAKLIEDFPELRFVGGGEESNGYLVGDTVRDKDAISASLLVCEIAVEAKEKNLTLHELLLESYKKYGAYKERLISINKLGKSGAQEITDLMERYRKYPPTIIAGIKVSTLEDYQISTLYDMASKKEYKLVLPKANVLIFKLEDGSQIALRPSGTEPKIKYYFSVNKDYNHQLSWGEQELILEKKLDHLVNELSNN